MKKLTREDFKIIHDVACSEWKAILLEWYGSKFAVSDEIEIKNSEYSLMRGACTEEQHKLLDKIFGKESDITDKIKSLEDAIKYLGYYDNEVLELKKLILNCCKTTFQELVVITKALNEKHIFDWHDYSEHKYGLRFKRGKNFSFDGWFCYSSESYTPSQLLYKSAELSEYSGKQFFDIWERYMK